MKAYDPLRAPDPAEWLALDEQERIQLVRKHHRKAGVRLPNLALHATIHCVIENQLAARNPIEAHDALARLMAAGLSRHEAIHAVGSALTEFLWQVLQPDVKSGSFDNDAYRASLRALSVQSWRDG